MSKSFCMIDCAMESPALPCIEILTEREALTWSYHHPSIKGMSSLHESELHDAYVVFGSYSNVGDDLEWHAPLRDFILDKLRKGCPVLGICFGHQLICHALGMEVGPLADKEVKTTQGHRNIQCIREGWSMAPGDIWELFVSHDYEVKGEHPDFIRLAESPDCPNEILCHKSLPFLGIQAHPEGSDHFVKSTLSKEMPVEERQRVQNSGADFLRRFIREVERF